MSIPSPELAPVLERIRARLLEVPILALHEAGKALRMSVAKSFNKKGVRSGPSRS